MAAATHLELRTPRLVLRPDDDAGLLELAEEARLGIHPPELMPFVDVVVRRCAGGARALQHLAVALDGTRRATSREVERAVPRSPRRTRGRYPALGATDFAVTRGVETGSWLGLRHQGRGIGTEMRAAVLMFAFDHLGATRARSAAFFDNPASLRVSEKLGYRPDGTETVARRGVAADDVRLLLTPDGVPPSRLGARGRRRRGVPADARRQPRLTPRANVSHCAGSPLW